VTWKLKSGVKWSDGQPFTAKDVVFTWEYVTDKATASGSAGQYSVIDRCEALDDTTVKVTFTEPQAGWFNVFVGQNGLILPEHVFRAGKGAPAKNFPANLAPIGTGPYKVDEFRPGDVVTYSINPTYRDPNGPFFDTITFKGGGDAPSAARAVLQTGDYDYAWNLQVAGTILDQLEQSGGKGAVATIPGASTERLLLNFTDPNKEVDGERSSLKAPHPFLTDKAVRQALALACDKKTIVDAIYKKTGEVANNLLYNPPQYNSPNTTSAYDLNQANQLLDQAGYAKQGQYRAKGGVPLAVLYQTTVNQVRQQTQEVVKAGWEKLGVKTELKSIDAGVYFSSDAGNPDTAAHFYADVEMYTNGNVSPDPFSYMKGLTTDEIAQKANQWSGNNNMRWSNKEYDAVIDQLRREFDPARRAALFIKANDIEVNDYAEIPLVYRPSVIGVIKGLQVGPGTPWDSQLWNVANWVKR
jgi:peptide/nickel transport system substrate-binding protein